MSTAVQQYPARVAAQDQPDRVCVNIGCGLDAPNGWRNFDNSPTIWISRLPFASTILGIPSWPRNVQRRDVLNGLPFPEASVDFIYSSHTFEHFTPEQSLALAKECLRVLRINGVLRIVVPDLERMVHEYLADSSVLRSHHLVDRLLVRWNWRDWFHPGAHHCQMFDGRSLQALFQEAGFSEVRVTGFGESSIPNILEVELESRRGESVYVEGRKGRVPVAIAEN